MMNQDSLQFALNAVSNIAHNSINRKNYKQQLSELQKSYSWIIYILDQSSDTSLIKLAFEK